MISISPDVQIFLKFSLNFLPYNFFEVSTETCSLCVSLASPLNLNFLFFFLTLHLILIKELLGF